jgi:hypothetical protein
MTCAIAVPVGNTSFSFKMTCFLNGIAKKTLKSKPIISVIPTSDVVQPGVTHPKNAIPAHQTTSPGQENSMGETPSIAGSSILSAGKIPMSPPERGRVPIEHAVVWITILSLTVRGDEAKRGRRKEGEA